MRVSPSICGITIDSSSTKHQDQSSPGWIERMIGWPLLFACAVAWRPGRRVATAHVPAREADAQVAPFGAVGEAFLAALDRRWQLGELDRVQVCAGGHD